MWIVQCKPNIDSPSWSTLGSYDNKASAIAHASRVSDECLKTIVIVTHPNGSVFWSNFENPTFDLEQSVK